MEWESWTEPWNKQWSDERLENKPDCGWAMGELSAVLTWAAAFSGPAAHEQAFVAAIVIHFTCTSRIHLFPLISRHEFSTHTLTSLPSGLLCSAALNRSAHSWGFLAWHDVDFKNLFDVVCFLSPYSQRVLGREESVRRSVVKIHLMFFE